MSPGLIRIVNNVATRALADGESDANIDSAITEIEAEIRPDVVHVHHLQFLSSTIKISAPTVVTLHDEWAWCAAGGLGLRNGTTLCDGPEPQACSDCHANWRPRPSKSARWLTKGAGLISPFIAPHRLHHLYKRIPAGLRPSPIERGQPPESPRAAAYRNQKVMEWFAAADVRIAPSEHLQKKAESVGMPTVNVIRHGLSADWFGQTSDSGIRLGLVSIGTIAHHKGTDRVVQSWRRVFPDGHVTLELFGPILDPEAALGHPVGQILNRDEVRQTLRRSRALLLGSRWPENAPLIILEARASGCPVIAPDLGGISELVHDGIDGFLFDPADPEGMDNALRRLDSSEPITPRKPPLFEESVTQIETIYRQLSQRKTCE